MIAMPNFRRIDAGRSRIDEAMGQQPVAPEHSEDALALEFVRQGKPLYRWSPGLGWMRDDGKVWSRDDKMTRFDLARHICRDAAHGATSEPEKKRIASARTVGAVLTLAQTDPDIVVPADAWDADTMALNTPGGIVDLRTGTMRARGAEYVTQTTRAAPVDAPCPTWDRFIADVFLGDRELIEFMRRSMGYWLTGDRREQVLFFLYGLGANGKSVLTEFVQWLAGTYTVKLPASALMQSKGERHPTELAQLRGKRLAVSSELEEGSFFHESLVKELTGDSTLTARFMRADFFEFAMQQKHVVVGNFKPRLRGGDPAMARRMLLVPFNASFKGTARDPLMLDKLKAEAPAILRWMIKGAMDWARDGLAVPAAVRAASAEYMSDHDDLELWASERCVRSGNAKASELYASFRHWKESCGEHAPSMKAWAQRLQVAPGIKRYMSDGVRYAGIRLSDAEERRVRYGD